MRALAALLAALAVGCVREVPPAAMPDQVVPPMPASMPPVPARQGRVIIDVADGPVEVGRLVGTTVAIGVDKDVPIAATRVTTQPLCTTPCAVDLAPGRYELTFPTPGSPRRLEVAVVDVFAEPTIYRRALGRYEPAGGLMVLGIVGTSLGGMSFITGAALFPIGLAQDPEEDGNGFLYAGITTLIAGMVVTALGLWAISADPATTQRGSSTQFALPPQPAENPLDPPVTNFGVGP